ncbi:hypothetical protein ABOZ73_07325 [Caulobacter sp. 73W]|uniref:Uncharacterized protein n=1 Tax=Caulobacter sp. 73W TaxID=3161137 RepID=A0AB39KXF3_9CAUL
MYDSAFMASLQSSQGSLARLDLITLGLFGRVGTLERGHDPLADKADPKTIAFADVAPGRDEQAFDVGPRECSRNRISEDSRQHLRMLAIHASNRVRHDVFCNHNVIACFGRRP